MGSSVGHPEVVYSTMYTSLNHAQPADEGQGLAYMTSTYGVASAEDSKDVKLWNMGVSCLDE